MKLNSTLRVLIFASSAVLMPIASGCSKEPAQEQQEQHEQIVIANSAGAVAAGDKAKVALKSAVINVLGMT